MSQRLQIPTYTDRWMQGDRFGVLVKVTRWRSGSAAAGVRAALLTGAPRGEAIEIARVKLDRSGKTVRVVLADCSVV